MDYFYPGDLAIGITILLGCFDECVQYVLPNRIFDIRDLGFNALAGILGVSANEFLGWVRKKYRSD